jgi:CBS-domain-containing membrane protein
MQGAAAILEYHTIDSPLAQPRNAMLGQIFSATTGIVITKLFQLSPHFESVRWVAGALAVGVASAFMGFTKTTHPPAGATALLCATEPSIMALGWLFLPMIILGTTLLLAVALLLNNIQRRFPLYWWTPADLSRPSEDDIERVARVQSEKEWARSSGFAEPEVVDAITINQGHIVVPEWVVLEDEERAILEILQTKLRDGLSKD